MFGTINKNNLYILLGIVFVLMISILIILILELHYRGTCFSILLILLMVACLFVVPILDINWSNQSKNNIRTAIRDNYDKTKNIVMENGKGCFSSDNENYSFEVIENTLVIKKENEIVNYISGDNY